MDIWDSAIIDWNKRTRTAIALGIREQVIYTVQKGSNLHLEAHQARSTGGKRGVNDDDDEDAWRIVRGEYTTKIEDSEDKICRRNVVLMEDGEVLLQRIGGVYNYDNYSLMQSFEQKGRELVDKVQDVAKEYNGNKKRSTKGKKEFHFGIWCATGHSTPVVSRDTKQEGNKSGQEAVMEFSVWMRYYVSKFVHPLVLTKRYNVMEQIKGDYLARNDTYTWLTSQKFAALAQLICHQMYSTFTPFTSYTAKAHCDLSDTGYTCLVNFGTRCYLDLPDYKLKVDLQPFDVVFFKSNLVEHSTSPNQGERHPEKRWAVSFYLRKRIQQKVTADPLSASDKLTELAIASKKKLEIM